MELKQLEYFIAVSEYGSLSKASVKLYTSQPNVSKVIHALENELGQPLFERTGHGLRLNSYGKSIYEFASNTIKSANLIKNTIFPRKSNTLYISTYQSNVISKLLVQLYLLHPDIQIEHRQGNVEEIITWVEQSISEIGFLYISQKHRNAFFNILSRKRLEFVELDRRRACIYVGPNSPVYERSSLELSEVCNLRFVRGFKDFFSMEDGLKHVNFGLAGTEALKPVVYTNSDHLATNLLLQTDLADWGIDLNIPNNNPYAIKNICVEGEDAELILGYVIQKDKLLSKMSRELIRALTETLNP